MRRREFISLLGGTAVVWPLAARAEKKCGPGADDSAIKVGNIMPYSGPASAFSLARKTIGAYFNKLNADGGINGRKIRFISYDDGMSIACWVPPVTTICSGSQTHRARRSQIVTDVLAVRPGRRDRCSRGHSRRARARRDGSGCATSRRCAHRSACGQCCWPRMPKRQRSYRQSRCSGLPRAARQAASTAAAAATDRHRSSD
jgi:hypothetical protein